MGSDAADRLIVALDVEDLKVAEGWLRRLLPEVRWFKVGMRLFTVAGPEAVRMVKKAGARVFLDLKYHDIPNTVGQAVAAAAELGVDLLTIHTEGGRAMMERAAEAAREAAARARTEKPRVLGVTVLTSLDARAMEEVGCAGPLAELTLKRAALAREAGLDGAVCSPLEARAVKVAGGPGFTVVTPGIRPAGAEMADQARAATPQAAVQCGADMIVVGRPILAAPDPLAMARRVIAQLAEGEKDKRGVGKRG